MTDPVVVLACARPWSAFVAGMLAGVALAVGVVAFLGAAAALRMRRLLP